MPKTLLPRVVDRFEPFPDDIPHPTVFASGSNHPGEIRGFTGLGIPAGVAVNELTDAAIAEIKALAGMGVPVFADSGAFSEVSADPERHRRAGLPPRPGMLQVVSPIQHEEWLRRLDIYIELAASLGECLYAVAPDRVGDQVTTLERLERYREQVALVAGHGARILLPLQQGSLSPEEFYAKASRILGLEPVPAIPMKKKATPPEAVVRFVERCQPPAIHLLGLGIKSRITRRLLRRIHEVSPGTRVSLDANLITAAVGRGEAGREPRRLTLAQDRLRDELKADAWHEHEDTAGGRYDYTESIGQPGWWLTGKAREEAARQMGLSPEEQRNFTTDPDHFLMASCSGPGGTEMTLFEPPDDGESPRWYMLPHVQNVLDRAWLSWLERQVTFDRKEEAIRRAFADHPAAGQFQAPRLTPRRRHSSG